MAIGPGARGGSGDREREREVGVPRKPEVEQGLLSLMRSLPRPERPRAVRAQFGEPPKEATAPAAAVRQVDAACGLGTGVRVEPRDVTAVVDAMTIGGRVLRDRPSDVDLAGSLGSLAGGLLTQVGADPARAEALVASVQSLAGAKRTTAAHVQAVSDAFGSTVHVAPSTRHVATMTVTGPAARVAAQVLELAARRRTECHADFEPAADQHSSYDVTVVRLEACTALSFTECRARVDPAGWARCNPYFQSVDVLERTPEPTGWRGAIRERVGPGLNRSVYETDLDVRFHEARGLAFAAFDLRAPELRHDDGRVVVDRGCVGVIDEGAHRRLQMVKVYRISDFDAPHDWVCQLWASQFVSSGWSCSWAAPMRRALRAWSAVSDLAVDLAGAVYDVAVDACGAERHPSTSVPPLHAESYEIPIDTACSGTWDADFGTTASISVPSKAGSCHLDVPPVVHVPPIGPETTHAVTASPTEVGDVTDVVVDLGHDEPERRAAAPGLYVGRLRDGTGRIDRPYSIYVTGVPGR